MNRFSKNRKIVFLLIGIIIFELIFGAVYIARDLLNPVLGVNALGEAVIPSKFKVCRVDSDCVQAAKGCRPECGYTAINKEFEGMYDNMLHEVCSKILPSFGGPTLRTSCFDTRKPNCDQGQCVYR